MNLEDIREKYRHPNDAADTAADVQALCDEIEAARAELANTQTAVGIYSEALEAEIEIHNKQCASIRAIALEEALAVMAEAASDYSQGKGVQSIVCMVLHSAMTRVRALAALEKEVGG